MGVFCRGIDSNLDAVVTSAGGGPWCSVIRFSPGQNKSVGVVLVGLRADKFALFRVNLVLPKP